MFRRPASKSRLLFSLAGLLMGLSCSRTPSGGGPQPPARIEFADEFPVPSAGGVSSLPLSLALDAGGNIFVADAGSHALLQLDSAGRLIRSIQNEHLRRPTGVAVSADGRVFVASYAADVVMAFDLQGNKVREIRGGPSREFQGPEGVALDNHGNLYVVEFEGHRIQKFDPQARFLLAWGKDGAKPGEFHYPVDATIGPDGLLYVADTHNRRVEKFTDRGEFLLTWGKPGTSPEMMDDIFGIAVSNKHVFLADGGNRRIQVWTLEGQHVLTYDLKDKLSGDVETPTDLALAKDGQLLVLDSAGKRVLRFRLNL